VFEGLKSQFTQSFGKGDETMDVQTATVVITGISIIIGIIVFILSRRQETETRQAALFMEIYKSMEYQNDC
jgi:nitrate reductase gamma subunit